MSYSSDEKPKKEVTAIKAMDTGARLPAVKEAEQKIAVRPDAIDTQERDNSSPFTEVSHANSSKEGKKQINAIRVLLVDDHVLMREGLIQLLSLEEDIHVVGEASDGFEALEKIALERPDVVLLDIHLPIVDGIA